jgi:hypothetical protein
MGCSAPDDQLLGCNSSSSLSLHATDLAGGRRLFQVKANSRFHQRRDVRRDRGSQALESIAAFEHRNYLAR